MPTDTVQQTGRHEGSPAGSTRGWWLALGAALVPYALLVARFDFACDDAFISFRYARHLAEGAGLRFNPGEQPPVEGFSNLLWVLWSALAERAGIDVVAAARVGTIAAGVALLALTTRFVARHAGGWRAALGAALVLGTLPPFAMWSTGGLETMPFALCLFGVFERVFARTDASPNAGPRTLGAAAWLVPAVLLRTDGALWIVMVLACAALGWSSASGEARRRGLFGIVLLAGLLLLVVAVHTGWRVGYFGDWVSNTARAKAGISGMRLERGLRYVASLLAAVPSIPLAALVGVTWRGGDGRPWRRAALAFALASVAYAIAVGGDFMAMGRFLVPALAMVAALFGSALGRWIARGPRGTFVAGAATGSIVALSVLAAYDVVPVPRAWRTGLHFRWNSPTWQSEIEMWDGMRGRAQHWSLQGRALALHTRAGESMIGYAIGAVAYPNELVMLDMFGLVDRDVGRRPVTNRRTSPGHDRFVSWEYFLDENPTYFGSHLTHARAPEAEGLGPDFHGSALWKMIEIERLPLDPDAGFPAGLELRLFRFLR